MQGSRPLAYSYVRFSTPEQATGDSIRRQTEQAERWATEAGVELDGSLRMTDEGLSGYHGRNVGEDAALGQFIAAVKGGKVPNGSVLLVESHDRLARTPPKIALLQFMDILRGGVDVFIFFENRRYTWDGFDEMDMMKCLWTMARAHEESRTKAKRVAAAWSAKRKAARQSKVPHGAKIPAWLTYDKAEGAFKPIPERVAIIRRIFDEALAGDGAELIAKRLNEEGVPAWGTPQKRNRDRPATWNKSYVTKILTSGQVVGTYTPTSYREAEEPVEGYYPEVVPPKLFNEVRAAMSSRCLGSGRTGRVSNLFTHLVRCGYCGGPAQHVNKGHGVKSGQGEFFACKAARTGVECEYHGLPYLPLESAFLQYCAEVDLGMLLEQDARADQIQDAQRALDVGTLQLNEVRQQVEGTLATLGMVTNPTAATMIAKQLDALGQKQEQLEQDQSKAQARLNTLQRAGKTTADHVRAIRELNNRLDDADDRERIALRKQLKHAIARSLESMVIYPDGLRGNVVRYDTKTGLSVVPYQPIIADIDNQLEVALAKLNTQEITRQQTGKQHAAVLVRFGNGHSRLFRWDAANKSFTMDSEDTSNSLVISGHDFMEGKTFPLPDESSFKAK